MINRDFELFMIKNWNSGKINLEEYQIVTKWMQKFQEQKGHSDDNSNLIKDLLNQLQSYLEWFEQKRGIL